ncbi:hypothetical protein OFO01_03395 [Campylobacter sp. JMF_01 NE2]|uniref:hypothetical protein n=1 Tax=unclassified Campylobacter TaxID=2593542 RepID=UPI0022E9E52D|nr:MULTISPECIES: hypothetical protein [unclassified Campylobacter]MDA3052488.1 hypothetical protein [Campylobacter sp. JMF_03 NE3]MDA3066821.1 hypothetical protein [Campylobacter sp. JMF_01 NE2]
MIESFGGLKYFAKGKNENINVAKAHEFLNAFKSKEKFLNYFKFSDLDFTYSVGFDRAISEEEFANLNFRFGKQIFTNLQSQNFTEFDALNEKIWLYLNVELIKNDFVKPEYFANSIRKKITGKENLKLALDSKNQEIIKDVVRQILRNLYGATELRGKKGIYQEISLAMAWWRYYIANEVAKNTKLEIEEIYKYFTINTSNYKELVMRMSGNLTIIADENIRNALITFLLSAEKFTGENLKAVIKKIGIESAWRLIGGLSVDDNLKIIKEFVK